MGQEGCSCHTFPQHTPSLNKERKGKKSVFVLPTYCRPTCRETKQEWDESVPLILMSYRATPQASTGVTPNMMMLGQQTRLPVQAMYGTPLGLDEEEKTVSEYVSALQEGLRAVYRHAWEGLQRAVLHQNHSEARVPSQRAGMDSRHSVGTHHQGAGQGTRSCAPETGQTALGGTRGSPRGV